MVRDLVEDRLYFYFLSMDSNMRFTAVRCSGSLWHMPWKQAQKSRKSLSSMRCAVFINLLVRRVALGG